MSNQILNSNHNLPEILVSINGHKLPCLLDLGSSVTVLNSPEVIKSLKVSDSNARLRCANGSLLPSHGESPVKIIITPDYFIECDLIVSSSLSHKLILGTDVIERLSFDQSKDTVILNDIEVKRYRPFTKFANLKTCANIELEPFSTNNLIRVKNPIFGIFESNEVFAERLNFKKPRRLMFGIEDTVTENSKFLEINMINNTNKSIFIKKNSRVGRVGPVHDNASKIFGLTRIEDTQAEKNAVFEFQAKRAEKYEVEGKIPKIDLENLSMNQKSELTKILIKNNLAFQHHKEDLGKIGFWRFTVPLVDENAEVYQPPRPIAPGLIEPVQNEFSRWQENDLIEEADSPVNIPLLVIRKPDKSVRLALDARKLNAHSIKDRFPMPNIQSMMHKIGEKLATSEEPYISTFDACRAYNQLLLKEEDKNKVAFSLFNKHWRSKRLLYGLANGPSAFCRLMSKLFENDQEIFVFIDDIIIISPNWESHKNAIDRMLKVCISTGLVLDVSKTQIAQEEVKFLGMSHTV